MASMLATKLSRVCKDMAKKYPFHIYAIFSSLWCITSLWIVWQFYIRLDLIDGPARGHLQGANINLYSNTNDKVAHTERDICRLCAEYSNARPDYNYLNLSEPKDYAIWWLEQEGVYTAFSRPTDLKRQLAFHMVRHVGYKKLPHLLEMSFTQLSSLLYRGVRIRKKPSSPSKFVEPIPVRNLENGGSKKSTTFFDVAIVLPFHSQEILKIAHMMESWNSFLPCHLNNSSPSPNSPGQGLSIHFVWAYALDFEDSQGQVIKQTLDWLWHRHKDATKCFASVTYISLHQNPAMDHFNGACSTFYQLMRTLGDRFDAMQLLETDVRPIRPRWLDAVPAFVSPETACTGWWMKGSSSMCTTEYDSIDENHDMHINGNALYVLNCPDFDDYLRRVQLFYSADSKRHPGKVSGCGGGYDHAIYQYQLEPQNYIYTRKLIGKFVHSAFVLNLCEDLYNPIQLAKEDRDVYLVHSKSIFLSDAARTVYEILQNVFESRPDPSMFEKILPLFHSGELDPDSLRDMAPAIFNEGGAQLPSASQYWEDAYPDKVYLWSLDFHAGPVSCNMGIYNEAGGIMYAETESFTCKFSGTCPRRVKYFSKAAYEGVGLETKHLNSEQVTQKYFNRFRDNPEHQRIDAFICSHPAANCQLFLPFKKPIIVYATTRLEFGRNDKGVFWRASKWNERKGKAAWKKWLHDLHEISQQPGSVVAANNMYDIQYIKYFTGIDAQYIPTWCGDQPVDYRLALEGSMPYVGTQSYHPSKATILIGPYRTNLNLVRNGSHPFARESLHPLALELTAAVKRVKRTVKDIHVHLDVEFMSDLNRQSLEHSTYMAIICIPYQVSTISIFEYYRLNIPLFFPSITLLKTWKNRHGILWERIYGWPERDLSMIIGEPIKAPDPNDDSDEAFDYWMQFTDWAYLPHIQIFDSFAHLVELLGAVDMFQISDSMKEYNALERIRIVAEWRSIFSEIKKVRQKEE